MSACSVLQFDGDYSSPFSTPEALPGPTRIPLVGQLPAFLKNAPHLVLQNYAKRYGFVFQYSLGMERIVCVTEPTLIKAILKARPHCFRRSKGLADAIESTGFLGVFTAEGDIWQRQRRHVMRGLRPQVVNASQAHINAVVGGLENKWRDTNSAKIDVLLDLKRAASDIVVATSLGLTLDTTNNEDSTLQQAIDRWFKAIGKRARLNKPILSVLSLFDAGKDQKAIDYLRDTAESAVLAARKRLKDTNDPPQNILEALIVSEQEDGDLSTPEDVVGNAVTMILAGQETTASSMAWLMFYLAKDKSLAIALRKAVDQVVHGGRTVDATVFDELPQLQQLCLEVLRLKPTAPLFGLTANHDISVAGLKLTRGQKVVLLARGIVSPECDAPNLSIVESSEQIVSGSLNASAEGFAFGAGPRLCPGRYLALVEMMTMTVMVVQNFDVELKHGEKPIGEGFTFAMHPRNLEFNVTPRV